MKLAVVVLMAASCSGLMVAPLPATGGAQRCVSPNMMWRGAKGVPKGKVPDKTKRDDKSWGPLEWFSELAGGSEEADTGPKFGGRATKGSGPGGVYQKVDDSGNWQGDRRIIKPNNKKTKNDGAKFNPLDASTW